MHVVWVSLSLLTVTALMILGFLLGEGPLLVHLLPSVLVGAPITLLVAALIWFNGRVSLSITTAGIEYRGHFSTQWVPWADIAIMRSSQDWYDKGATEIVTISGQQIRARFTASDMSHSGTNHPARSR